MTSFPLSPAVGITIGTVRKYGWYLSILSGFGYRFNQDATLVDGRLTNSSYKDMPFYLGTKSEQNMVATVGPVFRLASMMHLYLGFGYGYKSSTYRTNNLSWIAFATSTMNNRSPLHSGCVELGVIGSYRGAAISAGYVGLVGFAHPDSGFSMCHEIKIGVGGVFNAKGGRKRR